MRRFLVVLSVVAVVLFLTSTVAFAAEVVLSQDAGGPDDVFTFTGQGFPPGTEITVDVVTPDEQQFFLEQNGQLATLLVDEEGTFSLDFLPSADLPGLPDGTYTFTFTDLNAGTPYSVSIEVISVSANEVGV